MHMSVVVAAAAADSTSLDLIIFDCISANSMPPDQQRPPNSVPPSRVKLIRDEVIRFANRTTVRGVSRIVQNSRQPELRLLWVCAVIGAAVITLYQLAAVIGKYIQFEAKVVIYQADDNPEFPDVTVCKINPYSHPWHDPREPTIDEYFDFVGQLEADITAGGGTGAKWNLSSNFVGNKNDVFVFLNSPSGYFSNMVLSPVELDVEQSTMVVQLDYYTWNLDAYNSQRFAINATVSLTFNPSYQVCYLFRVPAEDATKVRAISGILYLYDFPQGSIGTFDPNLRVSESSGVSVMLHARGTFPDPMLGVNVAPGSETTISMKASVTRRLGKPYDNCQSVAYLTENGQYKDGALLYSMDACYDLCVQRYVMRTCQCIDSTITFTDLELRSNYTMCGHMNMTRGNRPAYQDVEVGLRQLNCLFTAKSNIENGGLQCRCPVPCVEYLYQPSVSSAPWPHRSFQLTFYNKYIAGNPMYGDKFDVYDRIQNSNLTPAETLDRLNSLQLLERNFLRLKILFDRRGIERLNNTSAMTWEDLASNVGGSLSLWIGITVMTFFELIELAYRLVSLLVFGHNLNIGDLSDVTTTTTSKPTASTLTMTP